MLQLCEQMISLATATHKSYRVGRYATAHKRESASRYHIMSLAKHKNDRVGRVANCTNEGQRLVSELGLRFRTSQVEEPL